MAAGIREALNERVGGNVVSYGESGVGLVNHETGAVVLYVMNLGDGM
ncbi:MAG: hypothetical protein NC121_18250 [Blautia sp.]|nr:hypothetical protein [Blautia sp.]